jgi:hypothetical protein
MAKKLASTKMKPTSCHQRSRDGHVARTVSPIRRIVRKFSIISTVFVGTSICWFAGTGNGDSLNSAGFLVPESPFCSGVQGRRMNDGDRSGSQNSSNRKRARSPPPVSHRHEETKVEAINGNASDLIQILKDNGIGSLKLSEVLSAVTNNEPLFQLTPQDRDLLQGLLQSSSISNEQKQMLMQKLSLGSGNKVAEQQNVNALDGQVDLRKAKSDFPSTIKPNHTYDGPAFFDHGHERLEIRSNSVPFSQLLDQDESARGGNLLLSFTI